MRQIGCELQGEKRVVQVQVLANILTQRCIVWQLQQATVVIGNFQFFGRAQHALALNPPQFSDLDQEGLSVFARWQLGPHHGAGHPDANASIGRTANDVEPSALPHIDLAHAQAVGIGMLNSFLDFTNNNFGKRRRHRHSLFHFKTGHGQGIGQLLGGQGRVAEFAQPGFGKLHRLDSVVSRACRNDLQVFMLTGTGSKNGYRHQRTGANRSHRIAAWSTGQGPCRRQNQ